MQSQNTKNVRPFHRDGDESVFAEATIVPKTTNAGSTHRNEVKSVSTLGTIAPTFTNTWAHHQNDSVFPPTTL